MKKLIYLFVLTLVFSFCKNKKTTIETNSTTNSTTTTTTQTPEETPTMTFTVDSIKMKSPSCEKENSNSCTEISVMYLAAKSTNASLAKSVEKINQSIKTNLITAISSYSDDMNTKGGGELIDEVKAFMGNYESLAEEEEMHTPIEHSSEVTILYDSPERVCLSFSHYDFTGGAHGNFYTNLVNYDKENGEIIKTDQLFKDKEKIAPFLDKAFRKEYELAKGEELPVDGGTILPNDNIGILKDSLVFQYNPYEIGPYAMGAPTLKVAKEDIKDLLH